MGSEMKNAAALRGAGLPGVPTQPAQPGSLRNKKGPTGKHGHRAHLPSWSRTLLSVRGTFYFHLIFLGKFQIIAFHCSLSQEGQNKECSPVKA